MGEINDLIQLLEAELKIAQGQLHQYVVSKEMAMKFLANGYINGLEYSIDQAKKMRDKLPCNACTTTLRKDPFVEQE